MRKENDFLNEKDFERWCIGVFKAAGIPHYKMDTSAQTGRNGWGWPDFEVYLNGGASAFIELKMPGNKLSIHQQNRHKELLAKGYRVNVCFYKVDVLKVISRDLPEELQECLT